MNDGRISLPPSSVSRVIAGDTSSAVKIISMPPNMPTDQPVKGEVVSHDKNVIVMKTEQGLVAIETKQAALANVQAGDVIQIKLQQTTQLTVQNIQNAMLVELLSINGQAVKPVPQSGPVSPVSSGASAVDQVIVPQQNFFEEYTSLQARLLGLPQVSDDESIAMVVKALLHLPVQDKLPPALQEGFDKFIQLTSLLHQANLLPEQQLQTGKTLHHIPEGLLTALQNILQTDNVAKNPLLQSQIQQFIQLQTVFPGEKLSPNILVDIRQQLVNILAQVQTSTSSIPAGQPSASVPLYTMPAIGMVVGMPHTQNPDLQGHNLVLMTTPDGQYLTGILTGAAMPQSKTAETRILLPGTVFVAAFHPQIDKQLTVPMLPVQALSDIADMMQPLHLTLGDTWPALDDLWQTVLAQHGVNTELAALMRQTIPAPQTQQFPPALLFFMAVIKNNLFDHWLAPEKLVQFQKLETVQQLLNDMRAIQSQLTDDGNPDSWKSLPMPMQTGDQLVRLQFFYRHPENGFSENKDAERQQEKHQKTRFILNIPHTHLGDLQIDGLVQFRDLEMILRTERALPSQAEQDIRARYQSVLETTGMHGTILFQSGREHYIRV